MSFIENGQPEVPFSIRRVYWIYDVPGGAIRGSHAFRTASELIVALSGSFTVEVEWQGVANSFSLNRSHTALFLPNKTWRQINNFSSNSLALVLSSTEFDELDYIRDHDKFIELKPDVRP